MRMVYYGYLWFTAFRRKKKKRALLERQTPWRHQPPTTCCLLNCSRHWGRQIDYWRFVLSCFQAEKETLQQELRTAQKDAKEAHFVNSIVSIRRSCVVIRPPAPKICGWPRISQPDLVRILSAGGREREKDQQTPGAAAGSQSLSFWGICRWFLLLDVNPAKLSSRWWCWPLATL